MATVREILPELTEILNSSSVDKKLDTICSKIHGRFFDPEDVINFYESCSKVFDKNDMVEVFRHTHLSSKFDIARTVRLLETFKTTLDFPILEYFQNYFMILVGQLDEMANAIGEFKCITSDLKKKIKEKEKQLDSLSQIVAEQSKQIERQKQITEKIQQIDRSLLTVRNALMNPVLNEIDTIRSLPKDQQNQSRLFNLFHSIGTDPDLIKVAVNCNSHQFSSEIVDYNVLFEAIRQGDMPLLQNLIQAGANVNVRDFMGNNLIHTAVLSGRYEMLEYLISLKRIDINETNKMGNTALHIAAMYSAPDLVDLICNTPGVIKNLKNRQGKTPMEYIKHGDTELCKTIFEIHLTD